MNALTKQPPAYLTTTESEEGILGGLLVAPDQFEIASEIVIAEEFSDPWLGRMFILFGKLYFDGMRAADSGRIMQEFMRAGFPPGYGDATHLFRLTQIATTSFSMPWHCAKVRDGAVLRRIASLASAAAEKVSEVNADPALILEWLGAATNGLASRGQNTGIRVFEDTARDLVAELRAGMAGQQRSTVFTGLPTFDQTSGGFSPGELILLAARTACGKTTMAMQIAAHNAKSQRSTLYVSLEMSDRELVQRILCGATETNSVTIRSGEYTDNDVDNLERAGESYAGMPFFIWSPARATVERILAAARTIKQSRGLELLVVDYLTLVAGSKKKQRYEEIGDIAKGLRAIGKELNVPVIALCQLGREAEDGPPKLRHLRESGDLEQDADIVLFLSPENSENRDRTAFVTAKHRNGPQGKIMLDWDKQRCRFDDSYSRPVEKRTNHTPEFDRYNEGSF